MQDEYVTIAEAAKMLNVGYTTMASRIKRGLVPGEKKGTTMLIKKRHIDQILNWGRPFNTVIRALKKNGTDPLSYYS